MESNGYLMIVETLTRFSFNIVCKRYDFLEHKMIWRNNVFPRLSDHHSICNILK